MEKKLPDVCNPRYVGSVSSMYVCSGYQRTAFFVLCMAVQYRAAVIPPPTAPK
jgi:hypothetical protein